MNVPFWIVVTSQLLSPVSQLLNSLIFRVYASARSTGLFRTAISLKTRACGFKLMTLGRGGIFGVGNGEGVRDVRGVEPSLADERIDREEGVRGSAENRFRLLNVALKGLLLLDEDRQSSTPGPLLVFGGGNGGSEGERVRGDREMVSVVSGRSCALPFGDDTPFFSCRLTQLDSRRNSIAGRRV